MFAATKRMRGLGILCILGSSILACAPGQADIISISGLSEAGGNANLLGPARALLVENQVEEAAEALGQLVTRDKDLPHPELLLVQLLIESGKPALAENRLARFSKSTSDAFEVSLTYARLAVQQKRWYDGWVHLLAAKAASMPARWSTEYQRQAGRELSTLKGICAEGRSDWSAAREAYRAVVNEVKEEALREDVRVLAGLGRAEFHLGDLEASLAAFRKLSELQVEGFNAELSIAKLFDQQGDKIKSEQWYRQALKDPRRGENAKLQYAQWLIWHNRPEEAQQVLPDQVKNSELGEQREYLIALTARMQRRYPEAQSILSRLHRGAPSSFAISNQLALVLIESDSEADRGRALQIAEANVRNNQQLAEAWSTLGWIQLRLGDTAAAQKSLALATQAGQITRDTAHFIAELQEAAGEPLAALEFRDAATKAKGPSFYTSAGK